MCLLKVSLKKCNMPINVTNMQTCTLAGMIEIYMEAQYSVSSVYKYNIEVE